MRGGHERGAITAVALGLLAIFVGCLKIAVLTHGVVFSALPALETRAIVVVALSSGLGAVAAGGRMLVADARSSRSLWRTPR